MEKDEELRLWQDINTPCFQEIAGAIKRISSGNNALFFDESIILSST